MYVFYSVLCTRKSGGVRDHGYHASQHPSHSFLYHNKQQWHGTLELNHISSSLGQIRSIPGQEPFVAFVWFVISHRIAVWYILGVLPTSHMLQDTNKYVQLSKPIFQPQRRLISNSQCNCTWHCLFIRQLLLCRVLQLGYFFFFHSAAFLFNRCQRLQLS